MAESFMGWTSYETYNVFIWLTNNDDHIFFVEDLAKQNPSEQVYREHTKQYVSDHFDLHGEFGSGLNTLNQFDRVDWGELARELRT